MDRKNWFPPWLEKQGKKWKENLISIAHGAQVLLLVLKHPCAPLDAKLVAGAALAYLASPIQLIPTFIPVIGQLDDLFVLFVGMKYLRKRVPGELLAECDERAQSWRTNQGAKLTFVWRRWKHHHSAT